MSESITVYTTAWCSDCIRSKRLMHTLNVSYHEVDIEEVKGAEAEMMALNGGFRRIPTILLKDKVLVEPSDEILKSAIRSWRHVAGNGDESRSALANSTADLP